MKFFRGFNVLCVVLFICSYSAAEECLTSTDARRLYTSSPILKKETLDTKTGNYRAHLGNGDVVFAHFAPCDLGIQAHYLSASDSADSAKLNALRSLLSQIIISDASRDKVLLQIDKAFSVNKKSFVLDGQNDQHQIDISPASSPLYAYEIHYQWLPPQY